MLFIAEGGFKMRTICKACGAPLHNEKCEYCGAIYKENRQTSQQPNTINDENTQSNMENINDPLTTKNKLAINTAAGILAAINAIILTFYNPFLLSGYEGTEAASIMLGLLIFIILLLMIVALVLHIIGLVRSKKHGISIVGHILGIIGALVTLLTITILSLISIILFFLSAIFTLRQKNVRQSSTLH